MAGGRFVTRWVEDIAQSLFDSILTTGLRAQAYEAKQLHRVPLPQPTLSQPKRVSVV